jgi:hypothetical protein
LIPYLASREIDSALDGGLWRALMTRRTSAKAGEPSRIRIVH